MGLYTPLRKELLPFPNVSEDFEMVSHQLFQLVSALGECLSEGAGA